MCSHNRCQYLSGIPPGARPVLSLVPAPPLTLGYAETLSVGVETPSMVRAPKEYEYDTLR